MLIQCQTRGRLPFDSSGCVTMGGVLTRMKDACKDVVATRKVGGARRAVLTFDDGPHPDVTLQVLELLARFGARAVFFIVGKRIERAPHLLARILQEGHVLGNHTWAHSYEPLSVSARKADLGRCQSEIQNLTGFTPDLYRPPQGRIDIPSLFACRTMGLRNVLWSYDTQDWAAKTPEAATAAAGRSVSDLSDEARNGDIILMHDDNPHSPRVLRSILELYQSRGYDLWSGVAALTSNIPNEAAARPPASGQTRSRQAQNASSGQKSQY